MCVCVCGCRCGCVDVWMCGCVGVWMCGCVDVWMCGRTCRRAMLRFLYLLFSSPASGSAWPMLHACLFLVLFCLLCPAATPALAVTTMCLPIFSFILSFVFLLKAFFSPWPRFFFFFFSSILFLSFLSLLPLPRTFCSHYFLFISVPIPGLFGLHSLPCHWTCSVRSVCEFK